MRDQVVSSAPVRLDLAGGWTDVPPFADREGGVVTNVAIDHLVRVTVTRGGEDTVLRSEDTGQSMVLGEAGTDMRGLDLLAAAVRRCGFGPGTVSSRSAVPHGSGLGASGALGVVLMAALRHNPGVALKPADLAEEAYQLESADVRNPGGRQDQWAAAFGGINRLEFSGDRVRVQPLLLDPEFRSVLEASMVVAWTGASRVSGETIARVMQAWERGDRAVSQALHAIRDAGTAMAQALVAGDLAQVGALLDRNWTAQQRLDAGMCTATMARYEQAARETGAVLGVKAVGAGAGGSMLFLAGDPDRVRAALREAGAAMLPVAFRDTGVTLAKAGVV